MSQLNINTIKNKRGDYGPNLVGHSTVTGDLTVTGNITGDGSGLTGLGNTANIKSNTISNSGIITSTGFVGPLTGNVTGNVTGNLTGDVTGNISGTTGTFSGDVTIGGTLTYEDVTNVDSVGMITARKGIQVLADGINAVGVVTATSYSVSTTEVIDSSRNLQNISTGSSTIVTLNSGINTTATSTTVVNREFLEVVSAGTSITLPASPTIGNQVNIAVGNFTDTVVLRNGSKIMGSADDLTLNTAYVNVQFVYVSTNVGWRIN